MEEQCVPEDVEDEIVEPSDEDDSERVSTIRGEDSTAPEDAEAADDGERSDPEGLPEERPRRSLKVVLTLQPSDGSGFRALLALGADGCDPILRSLEVTDLAAAWDELPGLLAEAEDQWANQPRYPDTAPTKPARAAVPRAAAKPGTAPTEGTLPSIQPSSAQAPSDQLALFG